MGTHQKLNYIHVFRAIAILFIVAGHCFGCPQEMLGRVFNVILKDGTVLFVFIAGFLFQYLSDNFSYPSYLKKKFFNVVLPYLVTSVIGIAAMFLYHNSNPFAGVNKLLQIGMFLTTGWVHNAPTWYIPMTCVFFLFAAILLKLEQKTVFHKYSLLFFLLPVLIAFSCLVPRYGADFFVTKGMSAWQAYFGFVEKTAFYTILFFPIYILGMFFARYREYIRLVYQKRAWLWGLFIGIVLASIVLLYYHVLPGRLLLPKILMTLLILGYLERYDEKIKAYPRLNAALGTVATYSFSIFFFHYYFIWVFHRGWEYIFRWDNTYLAAETFHFGYWLIYCGMLFLFSFFGSLFLSIVMKKVLEKVGIKHTRYFIGT